MGNLQPVNYGKRQYTLWFLTFTTVVIIVLGSFNGTLLTERLHSRLGFTYISTGNHQKMAVIGQSGVLVVPRHTVAKGLLKRLITDAAIIVNKSQQEVMEILL